MYFKIAVPSAKYFFLEPPRSQSLEILFHKTKSWLYVSKEANNSRVFRIAIFHISISSIYFISVGVFLF
ncbi:hypothetical protein A2924_00805 [Candidatus Giovannonibacteria bacterium RIFCSPLOWO2_01_FULL_44_16]|uniref:Uncharacterized protein n=1 Tax=Candidatus Giovannonibacteria bacterium RIFCSPLOWO2_01_FULL_44_16 TaxID=1798348 RepID=A0A1F5X480_9BACT|nr:MAG: hypothetical protein A2924_00805 [Candidatus Giovannonibacteria bacterium RIFCSPLOWO2_01_FULL_44_16]